MERGTSYFGVRDVGHVERDLDRFVNEGLNTIVHTFSERDMAFYTETMAEIVAMSNHRDLRTYVNPWGVGKVFGGEAFSRFIGKNPDARQQLVTGEREHAACFNNPAFRSFMRNWTQTAIALGPDALFWDEPHWMLPEWFDDDIPDDAWVCRCAHCRERYREQHDRPMPAVEDESIHRFREDSLLEFLDEMMGIAHEHDVENCVCLVPISDTEHGIGDWKRLAATDHIDMLSSDPYWRLFDRDVETFLLETTDRVVNCAEGHDLRSQIWIQGFGLPDEEETYDNVRTATRCAVDTSVDSVCMWGYDACRSVSSIASENPNRVWDTYLEEVTVNDA